MAGSDVGSRYTTTRMPGEAGDDDLPVEPFEDPLERSGFLPPSGFTLDPDDLLSSDLAAYANERDSLAFSMSLDAVAHRIASDLYTDAIHGFQDWAVKMGDRIVLLPRSWDRPFYDRTRSSLPRITLGGPVTAKPDHVGRLFTSRRARRSRPAKGRLLHVARSPGGAAWEVAGRGRSRPSIRRRCA